MKDLSELAAAERRDLADYAETLTDEEWLWPSLCESWSVRDVVAHVPSYDELGWPGTHAAPRGITALFGCAIAPTDGVLHHQDIRRALGHPRTVPPARLLAALAGRPEPDELTAR